MSVRWVVCVLCADQEQRLESLRRDGALGISLYHLKFLPFYLLTKKRRKRKKLVSIRPHSIEDVITCREEEEEPHRHHFKFLFLLLKCRPVSSFILLRMCYYLFSLFILNNQHLAIWSARHLRECCWYTPTISSSTSCWASLPTAVDGCLPALLLLFF